MTNRTQLIKARRAILTMAAELKNVVQACRMAGISRSQFYAMKKAYETHGTEGLAPRARRKPQMPNRTPALLEGRILSKTRDNPTVSYIRLAGQLQMDGLSVTPAMVRYVWQREGLSTRQARVQWVKIHILRKRSTMPAGDCSSRPSDHAGDRLQDVAQSIRVSSG